MSTKKYYCPNCDVAGYISHMWNGYVACYNCGKKLEENSYEWKKSQTATPPRKVLNKIFKEPYP